ncbi:hypothetical protein [uncultured Lactobacillus sp.]|uniref:hypothetical protein n=1 Tax=uncultured Lactobacillus sp. TaxID=153152 RepID=UPI0025E47168|nr:hypothetical protein [uncultured Lactobacillus sp.]
MKLKEFLLGAYSCQEVNDKGRTKLKVDLSPGLLPTAFFAWVVYKFLTSGDD